MSSKNLLLILIILTIIFPLHLSAQLVDKPTIQKGQLIQAPQINRSTKIQQYNKFLATTIYEENFESGGNSWSRNGTWQVGNPSSGPYSGHESSNCAATNLNGVYNNNADDWLISSAINLPNLTQAQSYIRLYFWEWFAIESGYDSGFVKISDDGGANWHTLDFRGGSSGWRHIMVNLTQFAGKNIQLAFHLYSDNMNNYSGWYIDDLKISLEEPGPLSATMVNLNHQNFPFIYMNVAIDTSGVGYPDLEQANFKVYENEVLQTEYFEVTPPDSGGGYRLTDIIFLMDNSGSMAEEQNAVSNNVIDFVDNLKSSGIDFALGLCRYGSSSYSGNPIIEDNGQLTRDAEYFKNNVWTRNVTSGSREPGYYAITQSSSGFSFRPGSQKVFIIITDETPDQGSSSMNDALSACLNNSITLFALTESDHYSQFEPITSATNGDYFDIYSNFDDIFNFIVSQVSNTYLIRYYSSDPFFNGIERFVEVVAQYQGNEAATSGAYMPGSAPQIHRTQNTLDLHTQAWAEHTQFTIEVEIIDNYQPYVQNATLYFKNTSSVNYQSVTMTNSTGNIWQGVISGTNVETPGLDYYITATDGQNLASDPTVTPRNNPYQIAILPNEAPQIIHTPITNLTPGNSIQITANIIDNTNTLNGAKLFYRKTGQLLYQETDMISISADNYSALIPASFATNDGVDYYLKAWDNFGVNGYHGTADNPHQIKAISQVDLWIEKNLTGRHNDNITIPIYCNDVTNLSVYSVGLIITFDDAVLEAVSIDTTGTICSSCGWIMPEFKYEPGQIIMGMAGSEPLSGNGVLIKFVCRITGSNGDTTSLHFSEALINEGAPAVQTDDGFFTVSSFIINGQILYFHTPYPYISNASIQLSGAESATITSNTNGEYEFTDLLIDNYSVTPAKSDDTKNSITPYDASLILRHHVGAVLLSPYQLVAGDVSNNGDVTPYDASFLLRYYVGSITSFPVGTDWTFIPHDFLIDETNWSQSPRSRNYNPLTSDQSNQDFFGIVFGDVSGNWATSSYNESTDDVEIRIDQISLTTNKNWQINFTISYSREFYSGSLKLLISNKNFEFSSVVPDKDINDVMVIETKSYSNIIELAYASSTPLNNDNLKFNLTFKQKNSCCPSSSDFNFSDIIIDDKSAILTLVDNSKDIKIPNQWKLSQNYPNPFNPETTINYEIPKSSHVLVRIYNTIGQEIKTLVEEEKDAGFYKILWDGTDNSGKKVGTGIYLYQLKAGDFHDVKKMLMIQ